MQPLLNLLDGYAWVEDSDGKVLLSSKRCSELGWPLPEPCLEELREAARAEPCGGRVCIRELKGGASLSVAAYPLLQVDIWPHPLQLVTLCPLVEAVAHRHHVIVVLLGEILGAALPAEARTEPRLTPQQQAIYQRLVLGLRYKEIAAELDISHLTVRVQISRMRRRLGAEFVPVLRRA